MDFKKKVTFFYLNSLCDHYVWCGSEPHTGHSLCQTCRLPDGFSWDSLVFAPPINIGQSHMSGSCQTCLETPKNGFLVSRFNCEQVMS